MTEPQHTDFVPKFYREMTPAEREEWDRAGDAAMIGSADPEPNLTQAVRILYTNYRGDVAWRRIIPREIRFGSNEWHKGDQWLMDALDLDKKAERTFALQDIREWHPLTEAEKQGLAS